MNISNIRSIFINASHGGSLTMKKLIVPVLAATSALGFAIDSDAVSAADFKVKIHHQK